MLDRQPSLDIPTIDLCRRLGIPVFADALIPTDLAALRGRRSR
jgi:hypothetical protein